MFASCHDCRRIYGAEHGFPDLIIPFWAWKEISPTHDDGGLLCPNCICKRLSDKGIKCPGAFLSGPIQSVSADTMSTMRRVENIELAIAGRDNNWSAVRGMLSEDEGMRLRSQLADAYRKIEDLENDVEAAQAAT